MTYKSDDKQIKSIPIEQVLNFLGSKLDQKRSNANSAFYISPFRNEKTASLHVNKSDNIWFDHSSNTGGSVVDLVIKKFNFTFGEAKDWLRSKFINNQNTQQCITQQYKESVKTSKTANKDSTETTITKVIDIQHYALIQYLKQRYIDIDIAKQYAKEIHYQNKKGDFFGIAFKNDSNGFEIRNKFFKGILPGSAKDITTIVPPLIKNNCIAVFEGFMDFLSYATIKQSEIEHTCIVLNSTNNTEKAINHINTKRYDKVVLFLDNDDGGNTATDKFQASLQSDDVIDMRIKYKNHEDLNEYLIYKIKDHSLINV